MEEAAAKMALRRDVIGERIRAARLAKHWKQKRLAAAVHVEPQTVSNWERSVSTPDLDMLEMIATERGVEVSSLLLDPDQEKNGQASGDEALQTQLLERLASLEAREEGHSEMLQDNAEMLRELLRLARGDEETPLAGGA